MEWWMMISAAVGAAVYFGYRGHTSESRRQRLLLATLAAHHGGNIQNEGWFALPQLRFRDTHGAWLVTAMDNAGATAPGQGPFSIVELELSFETGQNLAVKRGDGSVEGYVKGLVDEAIGRETLTPDETNFTKAFRIVADDMAFARRVLDQPVRDMLLKSELRQLDLRVEGDKIAVFSDGYPESADTLEEMIAMATLIAVRCSETR